MLANNHVRKTSSTCPTQIVQPTQDAKSLSSSSEKEKKEHDKGSRNNEQHSISSLTASCKELDGSCTTDILKHTTDHCKTDNHQKNQNHMQHKEHPCNSSKSSAIGNQTIATLAKKKTSEVPITFAAACSIPNARPLTPPLPPSPPSSTFDTTLNIDTFAKTDNSPSSFSSKNNKTSHNTELSSQTSVVSAAAACNSMLQKPPLERVVGNDNNTTPKTAHEKCKNIATKTENTSKVSKEGVSAESSAPEKSQFTCDDSDQIKKNQDTTEVTKHSPPEHTKKLSSEKPGLACISSSSKEKESKQKDNHQIVQETISVSSIGYKQKKQSAKILQNQNKGGNKSTKVLEEVKSKKNNNKESQHPKIFNTVSEKTKETKIPSDSHIKNSEVNKLISNSTNSNIEKTCIGDLNRKGTKEVSTSESWKEDSREPSKGNLGNIQQTRKRLLIGEEFYASENNQESALDPCPTISGKKSVSNENLSVTNLNPDTFVNGKKSLNSKPNSTAAITEVVNVEKPTCDLSETLARYQTKFGPIPTILTDSESLQHSEPQIKIPRVLKDTISSSNTAPDNLETKLSNTNANTILKTTDSISTNFKAFGQIPSPASPATVRGIPLSLVEEECAEISRRIDQGSYDKGIAGGLLIQPVTTTESDLSQISGTILVHATNTGGEVVLYNPSNGDVILNDCNIQQSGETQSLNISPQPIHLDEGNLQIGIIEGALNVEDSVGSMIALDNDVHILNGHVSASHHLISTQASQIDMTTLLSNSQPSSAIPVTTIVTSSPLLSAGAAAVKNEPEDLTGQRRDSTNNNNNNSTNSNNNPSDQSHLIGTANDAINVNATPFTHGSDPVSFTNTNVVATGSSGAEFAPFSDNGRTIYTTDPYREPNELYANPGPPGPDFGAHLPRSTADIQFVQYHYKGQGAVQPPPSGTNGAPISSPDSGIGDNHGHVVEPFDPNYPHADILSDIGRKPWSDYRQNEEKIHIPKTFSQYGFKYTFEAATSSSQRKEDDKITYINKGQFYGITLEYIADPAEPPLKNQMVKSVVMLIFREGKTQEEELKAWQFWHSRQHSVKQRILDADTKNSIGLIGCIDEISHNALAVYWNPYDSPAKVSLAVQCLSTDFSTQKGVKGLPLHIQIDTYEDPRDQSAPVYQRGYCQIKIFCDKGAERKARDEERRATKRRMTTTGKRRLDEMYHTATERSEFYTMAHRDRAPILFTPTEDPEKAALEFGTELPSFYSSRNSPPPQSLTPVPSNSILKLNGDNDSTASMLSPLPPPISETKNPHYSSPFEYKVELPQEAKPDVYIPNEYKVTTLNRDAHELIPVPVINEGSQQPKLTQLSLSSQHYMNVGVPTGINISGGGIVTNSPHIADQIHGLNLHHSQPPSKRVKIWPSKTDQIMIYVRQDTETTYTALHLVPPTVQGLLRAIESKYKINARNIRFLYRCNSDNVTAKIDDEMLRSYCNEDAYLMQVMVTGDGDREENNYYDITLTQT